ncbi:hypothetical protein RND71_031275 [Anisodus tanguticus]|uniref:Uncharacterized protein n=1 Tax=Anisodus tanguticus TaxID=243964 RepID=A0AAE1V5F4_9SOLA|nr:hypothetical protein RND71_031275 [Anisodus tanguticus]
MTLLQSLSPLKTRSNSLMLTQLLLLIIIMLMFFMAKITNATNYKLKTYLQPMFTPNSTVLNGCEDHCGNISIPYPFGTREGCYLSETFYINCNTAYSPPKAFLRKGNIEVTEVSLLGNIRLLQYVDKACYHTNGTRMYGNPSRTKLSAYSIYNSSMNKFIAVGCDTYATIEGYYLGGLYRTECVSSCAEMSQLQTTNGSCSGVGCCQIPIPRGIWNMNITVKSLNRYRDVSGDIDKCSFAFVTGESAFKFTPGIYAQLKKKNSTLPSVVDWFIGNISCKEAQKNLTSYACKSINSQCYEPFNGSGLPSYYYLSGYRCSCEEGFDGNPYIEGGCKDINECQTPYYHHNCKENSQCNNTYGNYTCICLDGFHGDGREGCTPSSVHGLNEVNKLLTGGAIVTTILLVFGGWLYFALIQRRKMAMKKIKFFKENGGVMLLEQLIRQGKSTTAVRIFTSEELKQATNNYDESRIVGQGGYGIVYKGYLPDNNDVVDIAIKKSKKVDGTQTEEFVNEVIVLSQINHRNAVKLLGCCFETEVPYLVYEYIDNGTLYDHLHDKFKLLSLRTRLRIATGTAEVLSYLHSAASTSIIHRDVKSTNILLDNSYTAKVSDFGASRLVPLDETTFSTMVRGTFGYLDPEYMQTSQLTDRSDVYSFGVVLAELLTGKKAISFDRSEEERSLANHFLLSIKENRLLDVLDCHILSDGNTEHLVRGVAMLAKRCLNVKGEDRPTMKEVATELQGLCQIISSNHDSEEYYCQVVDEMLTSYGSCNDFIMPDDCDSDELNMLPSMKK